MTGCSKSSRRPPFSGSFCFPGSPAPCSLLGIRGGKIYGLNLPPVFFTYLGAATFGLFGWFALGQFRACVKPTNWLLRCHGSGVIIKYRSFQNWRFPAENIQAVGYDYSEIAWARVVKERRVSPGLGRNTQSQVLIFLDLCLANTGTGALEARLQAEQKAEPEGRLKTIARDYPVEVLPGGIVRLRWKRDQPVVPQGHPISQPACERCGRRLHRS